MSKENNVVSTNVRPAGKKLNITIKKWGDAGDCVLGRVIKIQDFTSAKYGKTQNEYLIETEIGIQSVLLNAGTDRQLGCFDILGKIIYIEYKGKEDLTDGRSFKKFDVELIEEKK